MVQQLRLSGHTGPVTCLAHSSSLFAARRNKKKCSNKNTDHCCLLSGSEDGTARLWDLRVGTRASLCILSPERNEVTSVAFHPNVDDSNTGGMSTGQYPFTIFTSVGSSVYGYDLRQTKSPIIRDYHHDLTSHLNGGEEINQISFNSSKNIYFAVADDDGYARVTDKAPERGSSSMKGLSDGGITIPFKTCHHDSDESSSLVTSIAFRPRGKTVDLATGGTNCTVCLWDVDRPRRPSSLVHIQRDDMGVNQVCNPPIVHSLSWSPSGRLLAAGLGDGSTTILTLEGRKLIEGCRLRGGHNAAVAAVLFPRFGPPDPSTSSHLTAEDRLMISAGNDGCILFWDLGCKMTGKFAVDPSTVLQDCEYDVCDSPTKLEQKFKGLSTNSNDTEEPKKIFSIQHKKKMNWIESCSSSEQILPTSLFVADTSNDITVYTLSRI